jgi:hypothetical protein
VVIGPLIPSQGRKAAEISAQAEDWIERTVSQLCPPAADCAQRAKHTPP